MSFESPNYALSYLLNLVHIGEIQLPDFQRKWKWDNDRIRGLLASVSLGYPVGVVMLLDAGDEVVFATEKLSGSAASPGTQPKRLLLDGQQRLTSLYQSLVSEKPVDTEDSRKKKLKLYYYIDIKMAMDPNADREDAIVGVPQDRIIREDFGRRLVADYSTADKECAADMFPLSGVFNSSKTNDWLISYLNVGNDPKAQATKFSEFQKHVLNNITTYLVPTIVLGKDTSREAVCTVFEKVNSGGVPLNVFELLTATFATEGFRLKDDWESRRERWSSKPVLRQVDNVDFLQSVALLATLERRRSWTGSEAERPGVSCKKREVLRLKLVDYQKWAEPLTEAMLGCASFLGEQHIFRANDLPYRTQLVPLSVIKVLLKAKFSDHGVNARIRQWFWCGVLGELYGGANETRFARDIEQVPNWATGDGEIPGTVEAALFGDNRLLTLKSRTSAAYKGVYALFMSNGCKDWLENKELNYSNFFDYKVDIHHIFPKRWCLNNNIDRNKRESIVNKTPLSRRTNQKIGGRSPESYVPRIVSEADISDAEFNQLLLGHYVDPGSLRAADFDIFFAKRFKEVCGLISDAMGKPVLENSATFIASEFEEEPDEFDNDEADEESD